MATVTGYLAVIIGILFTLFYKWIDKHTKTKNEYLKSRFFGTANLVPIGIIFIILGLIIILFY